MGQSAIFGDSGRAKNLDGTVNHTAAHIRSDNFDHRNFCAGRLVSNLIHHRCSLEGEQTCLFDFHPRIGNGLYHDSLFRKGFAERNPLLGPFAHHFQGTFCLADLPHAVMNPSGAEAALGNFKSPSFSQEQV